MKRLGTKHPLLFTVVLFFAALLAASIFVAGATVTGEDQDTAGALGRIVVGLMLLLLFRRCFAWDKSLSGVRWALPALCIALYDIALNVLGGMPLRGAEELPRALLLGLAPAVVEETICRGVCIAKLRESGRTPTQTLWLSALLFGAIHLTNAVGMSLPNALIQTGYAVVIGLLLGAVYLRSGDIVSVILAHGVIDVSYQLFAEHSEQASVPELAAFLLLLSAISFYALWLARRLKSGNA